MTVIFSLKKQRFWLKKKIPPMFYNEMCVGNWTVARVMKVPKYSTGLLALDEKHGIKK